jgi:hypothetical protein
MNEEPRWQPTVGPEGLAITLAGLAQQVGAIEKAADLKVEALRREMASYNDAFKRETTLEIARTLVMLEDNAEKSTLRIEALRIELDDYKAFGKTQGDVIISKYDGIIAALEAALRAELAAIATAAHKDVQRLQEVKDLHWHEHALTHAKEGEAIHIAQAAMDKRLDAMNHLNNRIESMSNEFPNKEAIDRQFGNLEARVDRGEQDTRLRFERLDSKLNTLEKEMGFELRKEVRPVQDMRVGQGAIIAAIAVAISLISIIVVLANFAAARL